MKIVETTPGLKKIKKGCVLTIGNFDGVHIGHQEILTAAKKAASAKRAELIALTFEPHPVAILFPEKAPGVLTPLELKKHLLAECGVDCLIVLKDSQELLSLSPADFVERFLVRNIQPGAVVEGEDFNFGSGRTGNIHMLRNLGREKGFEVVVVAPKQTRLSIGHAVRVSSTIIRNLLESGKAADAAIALGRPYCLIGRVVPGHGRGRKLGFPTANLEPLRQIIPAEGVYAGRVVIADSEEQICLAEAKIPAVFSIGRLPTYGSSESQLIEAHLLVEDVGGLCGRWLAMDFVHYLRSQQKFNTLQELAKQIAKDCQEARQILRPAKGEKSKDERDYKTGI